MKGKMKRIICTDGTYINPKTILELRREPSKRKFGYRIVAVLDDVTVKDGFNRKIPWVARKSTPVERV
jgi:hypothetical protein